MLQLRYVVPAIALLTAIALPEAAQAFGLPPFGPGGPGGGPGGGGGAGGGGGGSGGAPLPLLGATLLGQAGLAVGG